MIESQEQYIITRNRLSEFKTELIQRDIALRLQRAEIEGMRSMIETLQEEVDDWESRR